MNSTLELARERGTEPLPFKLDAAQREHANELYEAMAGDLDSLDGYANELAYWRSIAQTLSLARPLSGFPNLHIADVAEALAFRLQVRIDATNERGTSTIGISQGLAFELRMALAESAQRIREPRWPSGEKDSCTDVIDIEATARQADCTHVDLDGDRAKSLERLGAFAAAIGGRQA